MSNSLLTYEGYDPAAEGLREALCTLGNGYVATRGADPESAADGIHYPGTYFAGCYNALDSVVAGRTVRNEDMVNAPNWLPLTFRIEDGEWFDLSRVEILDHCRELDMDRGVLTRHTRFRDRAGRITGLSQRRLVSMADPHLAALETTLLPENWSGRITVRAALDGQVTNDGVDRYRELNGSHLTPSAAGFDNSEVLWLRTETTTSAIRIAGAARVRVMDTASPIEYARHQRPGWVAIDLTFVVSRDEPVSIEKVVALFTSRDRAISECLAAARAHVHQAAPFAQLLAHHVAAWGRLWRTCLIKVAGPAQRPLNLHIFHLLQTLSEHTVELDAGVPARGLHGEAYRGHIFWDELFVLPFLLLRLPTVARSLLLYRWRRLPAARLAAGEIGHRGAMYPWQSGSDGREETQRVHLNPRSDRWLPDNSHLQRHVGLAIAYNVWQYYQATADVEFLERYGAEMLIEISRFWCDIASYNKALDRYEILGVMGPDEYHDGYPDSERPGIDNNTYTNVLAVWAIRRTLDALDVLPEHRRVDLMERLELSRKELDRFADVSHRMRVVFHEGVISQFEGYDRLAELDWSSYRQRYGDIRRLDRILEAEDDSVNRYRASKQADVLMLMYLFEDDELSALFDSLGYPLAPGTLDRTVDYYLARTSHGSTLSSIVHSHVLARTDRAASWKFFLEALASDIDDIQGGTTAEGVHLGAMAGTIDLLQRCYTGLDLRADVLRLRPRLPRELDGLELLLHYRGHWGIHLEFRDHTARISLRESSAAPITVAVDGQSVVLRPGQSRELSAP